MMKRVHSSIGATFHPAMLPAKVNLWDERRQRDVLPVLSVGQPKQPRVVEGL